MRSKLVRNRTIIGIAAMTLGLLGVWLLPQRPANGQDPAAATAGAGAGWEKWATNPVLQRDGVPWVKEGIADPCVLHDGMNYRLWFSGRGQEHSSIGHAVSADGVTWKANDHPVLDRGEPSSWEGGSVDTPCVIREDGQYRMWYGALRRDKDPKFGWQFRIGLATSADGINWTKSPHNPVLDVTSEKDAIPEFVVADPAVLRVGDTYQMWYTAAGPKDIHIALATSRDGIRWERHGAVLGGGEAGAWDHRVASQPCVLFDGQRYRMWYAGGISRHDKNLQATIGLAESVDGIAWMKAKENPILPPGPQGSFDWISVQGPTVVGREGRDRMWYTGGGGSPPLFRIGLAEFRQPAAK